MIVSISGRKQSGKSLVSNVLVNRGFVRYSFASFLKTTLSEVLGISIIWFYDEKLKETPFSTPVLWDAKKTAALSVLSKETIPHYADRELISTRDAMEYIGTSVLRRYDKDFHLKKTIQAIKEYGGDVVIDDSRFPNEVACLKEIGAKSFFVMRPFHTEYLNFASESSVNWMMPEFDRVIVNAGTKEEFNNNLSLALEDHPDRILGATTTKADILFGGTPDRRMAEEAGYLAATGVSQKGISSDAFICTYSAIFDEPEQYICRNPFIIENLKMWNAVEDIEENVFSSRGIPYQIINDELLSTAYRCGISTGRYDKLKNECNKSLDKSTNLL